MVKKSSGWNLQQMQDTLVKDTEQKITDGFERIANGESQEAGAHTEDSPSVVQPTASAYPQQGQSPSAPTVPQVITIQATMRRYVKERKQDMLVHCPVSLHRRLLALKAWHKDELCEKINVNDMVVEAIALWLDGHDHLAAAQEP